MHLVANILLHLSALWLIGFGLWAFLKPAQAARFMHGFASSATTHYIEQTIRLVVGSAFWVHATATQVPYVFRGFGLLLITSSALLLLFPWRLHQRFAQWAVPMVLRNFKLYAMGSLLLGALVALGLLP